MPLANQMSSINVQVSPNNIITLTNITKQLPYHENSTDM